MSSNTTITCFNNAVALPDKFNFSQPDEWPKWVRRFGRYRVSSKLHKKDEELQVNIFFYCMGDEADDIMTSFTFEEEAD